MDDLSNPREPLIQALRIVVHIAVRLLAVLILCYPMGLGRRRRHGHGTDDYCPEGHCYGFHQHYSGLYVGRGGSGFCHEPGLLAGGDQRFQ